MIKQNETQGFYSCQIRLTQCTGENKPREVARKKLAWREYLYPFLDCLEELRHPLYKGLNYL